MHQIDIFDLRFSQAFLILKCYITFLPLLFPKNVISFSFFGAEMQLSEFFIKSYIVSKIFFVGFCESRIVFLNN